jgi:tRNA-dihydrouridine synthase B
LASPTDGLLHPIRLADRVASDNLWLAPMAGYSDAAFRTICAARGAALCYSEMVSAEGLSRDSRPTLRLLDRHPPPCGFGVQIFASEPGVAAAAVRRLARWQPDVVDLNCGCSVPKVLKGGCGAALLREPARIGAIVAAMRGETDRPVSVKLRLGWDEGSHTYLACAEAAVSAGAALVALHPRTRAEGFRGTARWEHIRRLKAACPVPVFGSGDLFAPEDGERMLRETGCDGLLLARGCLGNPFLFERTRALLLGGEAPEIEAAERIGVAMEHLRLLAAQVGEAKACRDMRKHFVAYTRGMEGGAALRQELVHAETISSFQRITEEYLSRRTERG